MKRLWEEGGEVVNDLVSVIGVLNVFMQGELVKRIWIICGWLCGVSCIVVGGG